MEEIRLATGPQGPRRICGRCTTESGLWRDARNGPGRLLRRKRAGMVAENPSDPFLGGPCCKHFWQMEDRPYQVKDSRPVGFPAAEAGGPVQDRTWWNTPE